MTITVDIDQFYKVKTLGYSINKNNIDVFGNYFPKEMFNMIQLNHINFSSITGYYYGYFRASSNHNICKWNNLNLVYNYEYSNIMYIKNNKVHIKEIKFEI